jgi:hypothetical protein
METMNLISARLEEGLSIKTCNQCKYETDAIPKMLDHQKECGGMKK